MGLDLLCDLHSLLILNRCHLLLPEALPGSLVISEIELRADENDRDTRSVVLNFGIPLQKKRE